MTMPEIKPGTIRIGWIGAGVMGSSMCSHLIAAGYEVGIYSRTKSKASGCLAAGAQWMDSPRQIGAWADVAFSIVGFPHDVREVVLGNDGKCGESVKFLDHSNC